MVNAVGTLKPNPTSDIPGIFTQLFSLSPTSLYEDVDTFTRDATLYMSQELGWGMGWAIFAMSVGLKLIFLPLQAAAQLQSVKMRLISKETKAFQERTKLLAKKGDYEAMKEEREKFSELRRSHGISTFIPLLGLVQVPFLITWFVSLRYMTMNPDLFPGMLTGSWPLTNRWFPLVQESL
jgi:YidC/Oxa1 family membrane protein insertase